MELSQSHMESHIILLSFLCFLIIILYYFKTLCDRDRACDFVF